MKDSESSRDVAALAHDIKQMLMVITGRAGLLLERGAPAAWQPHLQAMELAATDAAAMLRRLVDGREGLADQAPACVAEVVAQSCQLILPPDGRPWPPGPADNLAGGWTMEQDLDPSLAVAVPGQVLREVLNNLLVNALQVMPEGGRVTVTGVAEENRVALRVADTGPGVPPGIRESLFEPGVTTSGETGRGLGLASCRQLLRRWGGDLVLADGTAAGAVFLLTLPRAPDVGAGRTDAAEDHPGTALEPGDILVVDDDPAVAEMLDDLLGALGWTPRLEGAAAAALAGFTAQRYPVALIDQNLPGMSGLELAKELRRLDPAIILVLVTGWGNEDIVADARKHGCDLAAEKPLTVKKIRQILTQAGEIRNRRLGDKEVD